MMGIAPIGSGPIAALYSSAPAGGPNVWISGGSEVYSIDSNWSALHKPAATENALWNGSSVVNCTLDENTAALGNMDWEAAYTGTFDAATYDIDCVDFTAACTAWDAGSGSHAVGGNFKNNLTGTFTVGTADWTFTGASKVLWLKYAVASLYDATIAAGASYAVSRDGTTTGWHYTTISNNLVVDGSLDIASFSTNGLRVGNDVQVPSTGTITGTGKLLLPIDASISVKDGVIDCDRLDIIDRHLAWLSATYESANVTIKGYGSSKFQPSAGTLIWEGDVTYDYVTGGIIDNATYNPNVIYRGDVTIEEWTYTGGSGTHEIKGDLDASAATSWDDGTETWEFIGDADQDLSGPSTSLGDVLIDNAVDTTVYLTSDLTCENITHNGSGSFNANNYDVNTNDVKGAGRIIPNGGVWYLDGWWTGTNTEVTSG